MERRRDKKNILIVFLLGIVMVMSVGFALLSTNLEFESVGTVSGEWNVQYVTDSLEQVSKTDGVSAVTAEMDSDNLKVTLKANFEKPGDKLVYKVDIENDGSIDAFLKNVVVEGDEANSEAIKMSYEVKNNDETTQYAVGSIVGNEVGTNNSLASSALLNKKGDSTDYNHLYVTLEYLESVEGVTLGEEATYTLNLYYEQTDAN